jgi:Ceramidase
MCLCPLIGIFYSNPTREWRFFIMYSIIIIIGLGSATLHATLNAWPQSFDEVPMLWMNVAFLYSFFECHAPPGKPKMKLLPYLLTAVAMGQTVVYYTFQEFYHVFLATYISVVVVVVLWSGWLAFLPSTPIVARNLWKTALLSYVLIGSPLWIFEMMQCENLLPYYRLMGGTTFHILWHLGAGIGSYLTILFLSALRISSRGGEPALKWVCLGLCPIIADAKKRGE